MSGGRRRSGRDRRRRSLGQNFLVDQRLIAGFVADLGVAADELIVDLGAGAGALTLPLAKLGARVWAVEMDPVWVERLDRAATEAGLGDRVRPIRADLRRLRFPKEPFRVVANPPFGLTTELLARLLDDPSSPLTRADLILQREVVAKHSTEPPTALRTAAWAPWWRFTAGQVIPRSAFRPRPAVDAAVLRIERRDPPILPLRMAPGFADLLREPWQARRSEPSSS